MILAWDNKADAATVAASSQLASLPGSNVQNSHVSRVWSTAAAVTSATLTLDMLSSVSCAVLALLGTNLTSAATVRLRGSDSDATGATGEKYDSGTIAAGVKARYGAAYLSFTAAAARYWLINLADATLTDGIEVGRVFLGPKWTATVSQGLGWSSMQRDESRRTKSYGGQSFADEVPQVRVLQFTLDFMTAAEMYGNAFAMARANGIVRDVLAINDPASAYLSEQSVWGLLTSSEPLVNETYGVYRQKFSIEERL